MENSKERRFTLGDSYTKLSKLSLKEDELFRQALRCVELEVFRAAHIMAWCGYMNCIYRLLESDGFTQLAIARPNWSISSIEDLRENYTEHAVVDVLKIMSVVGKAEQKAMFGMLSKRNECAHPTDYFPDFNQSLGYLSEIFMRLEKLEKRFPNYSF
tara:strand:+ start:867 stop:1337 length:471 start_codon:yes stop_codon:yes gene_type:complete